MCVIKNNIKSSELHDNTLTNLEIKINLGKVENEDLVKLVDKIEYKCIGEDVNISQFIDVDDIVNAPVFINKRVRCIIIDLGEGTTLYISNYFIYLYKNNNFNKYKGMAYYTKIILDVLKKLFEINNTIVISTSTIQKNNNVIFMEAQDITKYIETEFVSSIKNNSVVVDKETVQTFQYEDITGKLKMNIQQGLIEDTEKLAYRVNFNLNFGKTYEEVITIEKLEETLKQINNSIFNLYKEILKVDFLDLLINSKEKNIFGINKNNGGNK